MTYQNIFSAFSFARLWDRSDIVKSVKTAKPTFQQETITLRPAKSLDHRNYLSLIAEGSTAVQNGSKRIEINMEKVDQISIAGLFALYSLSLTCQGKQAVSFEEGRVAIAEMAKALADVNWHSPLVLKNTLLSVEQQLIDWGFLR